MHIHRPRPKRHRTTKRVVHSKTSLDILQPAPCPVRRAMTCREEAAVAVVCDDAVKENHASGNDASGAPHIDRRESLACVGVWKHSGEVMCCLIEPHIRQAHIEIAREWFGLHKNTELRQ